MSQEGMLIISPKECGILLHCNVQNWVLYTVNNVTHICTS